MFTNKNELSDLEIKAYEKEHGLTELKAQARKAGKYWVSLFAHNIGDNGHIPLPPTEYPICYWVNYGDNETYGWFTVEQIKEWLITPDLKLYKLGGTRERIES